MRTIARCGVWVLVAPVLAQQTWVVNAGGGPGVQFTDLPSAVAAASSGDVIRVQTGPANEGATPFTTDKGLTIVGEGGYVPITSSPAQPFAIVDLPAGEFFTMVGFERTSPGALDVRITNCRGQVHLDKLAARVPETPFPTWPAFVIQGSEHVTMHRVENFGAPAMQIDQSRVSMAWVRLGVTEFGLAGGAWIVATDSTVDIVDPHMDTGFSAAAGIVADHCALTITGVPTFPFQFPYLRNTAGDVIVATGGTVRVDPVVEFAYGPAGQAIAGSAVVTNGVIVGTVSNSVPYRGTLWLESRVPSTSVAWHAIGAPGAALPSPLGTLWIDAAQTFYVLGPLTPVPYLETASSLIFLATVPPVTRGSAFTAQVLAFDNGMLWLGLPCTVVVY